MSLFITYREEKRKDLSLNKGDLQDFFIGRKKRLGTKKSVEGLFNHTEKENDTQDYMDTLTLLTGIANV